jgi:hypothetical protein
MHRLIGNWALPHEYLSSNVNLHCQSRRTVAISAEKEMWIGTDDSYSRYTAEGIVNAAQGDILEACASRDKPPTTSTKYPAPHFRGASLSTTTSFRSPGNHRAIFVDQFSFPAWGHNGYRKSRISHHSNS